MKKRWVVLIAVLSLAVGFWGGALAGVRFWQSFDEAALETRYMADAKTRLAVLKAIRSSNQDHAVLLLENLLDGDIIGIDSMIENSDRKAKLHETMSQIAKYRSGTNYQSSNGEVASVVQHALKRVVQPNITVERDASRPSP